MKVEALYQLDFEESASDIAASSHDEQDRELALREAGVCWEIGDQGSKRDEDAVLKHGGEEVQEIYWFYFHPVEIKKLISSIKLAVLIIKISILAIELKFKHKNI